VRERPRARPTSSTADQPQLSAQAEDLPPQGPRARRREGCLALVASDWPIILNAVRVAARRLAKGAVANNWDERWFRVRVWRACGPRRRSGPPGLSDRGPGRRTCSRARVALVHRDRRTRRSRGSRSSGQVRGRGGSAPPRRRFRSQPPQGQGPRRICVIDHTPFRRIDARMLSPGSER
jgi:hypothetical protein